MTHDELIAAVREIVRPIEPFVMIDVTRAHIEGEDEGGKWQRTQWDIEIEDIGSWTGEDAQLVFELFRKEFAGKQAT